MNRFYVFLIRVILGAAFAIMMMRFFYPRANVIYVAALAVFLVGMAYVTEFLRSKK